MKMKWFEANWCSSRSESAGKLVHFQAFRDAEGDQFGQNPQDMKMASPRFVSALNRAESLLRARFLSVFRHYRCHFVFIFEFTSQSTNLLKCAIRLPGLECSSRPQDDENLADFQAFPCCFVPERRLRAQFDKSAPSDLPTGQMDTLNANCNGLNGVFNLPDCRRHSSSKLQILNADPPQTLSISRVGGECGRGDPRPARNGRS